jgi:hypothetical protein
MSTNCAATLTALLLLLPAVAAAADDDPCAAFSWDVHHERALFATPAKALLGGHSSADAPAVSVDHLYALTLTKQSQVSFAVKPGRSSAGDSDYAAIIKLTVPEAGTWRISLDSKVWVDVLADGAAIASADFQGRAGCNAPHKIVEFVLPAGKALTVQISAAAAPLAKLAVTRAAAHAP